MYTIIKHFMQDERGATAIEYGLIVALVSVAIVGVLGTLSGQLTDLFTGIGGQLENATAIANVADGAADGAADGGS